MFSFFKLEKPKLFDKVSTSTRLKKYHIFTIGGKPTIVIQDGVENQGKSTKNKTKKSKSSMCP